MISSYGSADINNGDDSSFQNEDLNEAGGMTRSVSSWWLKDMEGDDITTSLLFSSTRSIRISKQPSFIFAKPPRNDIPEERRPNLFWRVLGFDEHPLISNKEGNNGAEDLRLSMLSALSTHYNVVSISLALDMMSHVHNSLSASDKSLCSSALLAGMIVGQLGGGALGDLVGRHTAMAIVMFLQIFSSLASAFSFDARHIQFLGVFPDSSGPSIFEVLAFWRFILGVGCGGVYPLSATMTAESASQKGNRAKLVALTFSMQGIGYLIVPMVAFILILLLGEDSDLAWRLLLGFGCIPGIKLTMNKILKYQKEQQQQHEKQQNKKIKPKETLDLMQMNNVQKNEGMLDAIKKEDNLVVKLLGTAGCWFLSDIVFYGNILFQPVVFAAAFGNSETILKTARDSCITTAIALPGCFVCVAAIGRQSPKFIQMQGYLFMAFLYFVIGFWFNDLGEMKIMLLFLYGGTFFFSNYGPNATTFILPSMTFSRRCRSTLNGICAAAGKFGALVGTICFVPVGNNLGSNVVLIICAVISLISYVFSYCFIEDAVGLGPSVSMMESNPDVEKYRRLLTKNDSMYADGTFTTEKLKDYSMKLNVDNTKVRFDTKY